MEGAGEVGDGSGNDGELLSEIRRVSLVDIDPMEGVIFFDDNFV